MGGMFSSSSSSSSRKGSQWSSNSSGNSGSGRSGGDHASASWRDTIRRKLEAESAKNSKLYADIQENLGLTVEEFIDVLGDEDKFMATFLKPNYNSDLVIKELGEDMETFRQLGYTEQDMKEALRRMEERRKSASDLSVKFVLTTVELSNSRSRLQNWAVRRAAELAGLQHGALHAALLVDGNLIEWGRGNCGQSLVVPVMRVEGLLAAVEIQDKTFWQNFKTMLWNGLNTLTFGFANFVAAKLAFMFLGDITAAQLRTVAKVCCQFNRYKSYSVLDCNCQRFVRAVCDELRLKLSFSGELQKFLDVMIRDGQAPFTFAGLEFKTRGQLDKYVMANEAMFKRLSVDDRKLLHMFRYMFIEYHAANESDPSWSTTPEAQDFWKGIEQWEKDHAS